MKQTTSKGYFWCPLDVIKHKTRLDIRDQKKDFNTFIRVASSIYNSSAFKYGWHGNKQQWEPDFTQLGWDIYELCVHYRLGAALHLIDENGNLKMDYDTVFVPVEIMGKWYMLLISLCAYTMKMGDNTPTQPTLQLLDLNTLSFIREVHQGKGYEYKRIIWSLVKSFSALHNPVSKWRVPVDQFRDMLIRWNNMKAPMRLSVELKTNIIKQYVGMDDAANFSYRCSYTIEEGKDDK